MRHWTPLLDITTFFQHCQWQHLDISEEMLGQFVAPNYVFSTRNPAHSSCVSGNKIQYFLTRHWHHVVFGPNLIQTLTTVLSRLETENPNIKNRSVTTYIIGAAPTPKHDWGRNTWIRDITRITQNTSHPLHVNWEVVIHSNLQKISGEENGYLFCSCWSKRRQHQ